MARYRKAYPEGDFRNRIPISYNTPAEAARLKKKYRTFSFKKKGDDALRQAVEVLFHHFETTDESYTFEVLSSVALNLAEHGRLDYYWLINLQEPQAGAEKRQFYLDYLEALERGELKPQADAARILEIQALLIGKVYLEKLPKRKRRNKTDKHL
jgi:hypothetical protein